ncbi:hypothetical protein J6590_050745 [Homalodisca vitripennis]|nr:hypothetical protein J6590_050745 [Homalodisca vitripennis]
MKGKVESGKDYRESENEKKRTHLRQLVTGSQGKYPPAVRAFCSSCNYKQEKGLLSFTAASSSGRTVLEGEACGEIIHLMYSVLLLPVEYHGTSKHLYRDFLILDAQSYPTNLKNTV